MRSRWLPVVVFVVGSASLGTEIAAARLLAPWFGASTIVWANTIATVLVALSVGYFVGGRLADRRPTLTSLSTVVLTAAALLAVVPFVSGPLLRSSTKAFSSLSAGLFLGSLLGVGLLIAVPVLLLGMVSPYAIRLRVDAVKDAGRVSGRLYAIGTVGSLAGTFAAALLLIPVVGTQRTFLTFALSLALVAAPGLLRIRPAAMVAAAVALAIVGLLFVPVGLTKAVSSHGRVIKEVQTDYQYARVVQSPTGVRTLELDAGQAVHSMYHPGQWLTGGYWDQMLVLPFTATHPPRSVAILGSAAGTTARALAHYWPGTRIDAVELDPDVTELGKELFDLGGPGIHPHTADARPWLISSHRRYDAILVDAYRQPYIPFYLTTAEFFASVRSHLTPGGVAVVNVGHPQGSQTLEKVLTATMRTDFPHLWRDPSEPTNTMLLGTTTPYPAARLRSAVPQMPAEVAPVAQAAADRLEPGLRGGEVWTDDRAPVEWLINISLARLAK